MAEVGVVLGIVILLYLHRIHQVLAQVADNTDHLKGRESLVQKAFGHATQGNS